VKKSVVKSFLRSGKQRTGDLLKQAGLLVQTLHLLS
jgi:hypothetical protein